MRVGWRWSRWSRWGIVGFVTGCIAAIVAVTACSSGDCSCTPTLIAMSINSPAGDLIYASGCGQTATCQEQHRTPSCDSLLLAPPTTGGTCQVTISFNDGTQTIVDAQWGAAHQTCCGTSFDNNQPSVTVHDFLDAASDAASDSAPDSASDSAADSASDSASDSAADSASD